ncbi:NADPH oxidase regulator NoxR [Microthyrium microscopicum]|uniref:NADPH oxidase regulator NoxR n=1 Tax=Microthyrium microscopicum TaxID=703497 RepID=A0A6A6UK55_9PEZI|nr:NADPH oxidase regulator NoxR [Microthyrium microscopicum]
MSLKQEIETWVKAVASYDNNDFDEALNCFAEIADTSKILFNCGVIHATLGEHEKAVKCYTDAIKADNYLAVAYFQQGVSNFLVGDFEEALANFNDTLLYLRGNKYIDYEQLGLKFKLYSCEVLFNRGLCYIYLQQLDQGLQDLNFAVQEKAIPDHDVIDDAIKERAEGYTVFSIPVGVIYRPNEAKVKNLRAKDYLGKAKLIATVDQANAFTGFTGAEMKRMNGPDAAKDDRPEDGISYAASNLVKPEIKSRNRQPSEPTPPTRDMFPPTPPPDGDRSKSGGMSRAESVRAGPKPRPLDLSIAGFDRPQKPQPELSRSKSERSPNLPVRSRTQSERPNMRDSPSGLGRMQSERRPSYASSRGNLRSPNGYMDDQYDEVFDMYGRQSVARNGQQAPSNRSTNFISEEDEDEYGGVLDEPEFDMMSRGARNSRQQQQQRRSVDVKKIRVKVHSDDTRYVMIGTAVEFRDFIDQIRTKFGIRQSFKVKIKDDGDMITMADQDDLEMALMQSVSDARKERNEMGKMEVWIQPV